MFTRAFILFLLLETTSFSLSSSSSSSSCEIIIRGESDEKAKTQQNSHKTKKILALLIICHKTTQLTEREFRRN